MPGRVAQSIGHLTRKSEVLDSIPDLATYFQERQGIYSKIISPCLPYLGEIIW